MFLSYYYDYYYFIKRAEEERKIGGRVWRNVCFIFRLNLLKVSKSKHLGSICLFRLKICLVSFDGTHLAIKLGVFRSSIETPSIVS